MKNEPNFLYIITLLTSFLFSLVLTPLVRRLAVKEGFIVRPRDDRWSKKPTALLGGVGIFSSLIIVWLTAAIMINFKAAFRPLLPLAIGGAAVFLLGLIDDLFEISPQHKLVGQIIIASVLVIFGFQVNRFNSATANQIISIFWIVGITNAFNLLDNMDGLSAGIAFIAGLFLFLFEIFSGCGSSLPALLLLSAYLGALGGFLIYNFHPASIFMGDAGSLFIGFILAGLTTEISGLTAGPKSGHLISVLVIPVLILFIPILDTTFVSLMRKLSGRPISMGGLDHSSHRMVAIGFSERTTVLALYGFAVVSGLLAMIVTRFSPGVSIVFVATYLLFVVFFWIHLAGVKVYPEESIFSDVKKGKFTPLLIEITYKKRLFEALLDLILIPLAYWSSYLVRFEGSAYGANLPIFFKSLPIVVACQFLSFFFLGVYQGIWQYAGMRDVITYIKAVTLGTVLSALAILGIYRFASFSRTLFIIYWMILIVLITASRFSYRLIGEAAINNSKNGKKRTLIYGAGAGGQLAVREIERNQDMELVVIGFIDDDIRKQNKTFMGYPVLGGKDRLSEIIDRRRISEVVISFRSMDKTALDSLKKDCNELDVNIGRLKVFID